MTIKTAMTGCAVGPELNTKVMHEDMQTLRKAAGDDGRDVTLKSYLQDTWGADMTPELFYKQLGLDISRMSVQKMLNTSELNRWLFPEVVRDAVLQGLTYTPFYGVLTAGEENIPSTGLTMPAMDFTTVDMDEVRLRDTNEGATITEGQIITWSEKQVTVKKKARGLMQTYESIMFCPIDLAAIYFEEMGQQLGADLDSDLINIAFNGDQADGSQAAPVIGAATAGTLTYQDIVRAWIRFARIGRTSTVLLTSENDASTILNLPQFQRTVFPGAMTTAQMQGGPTLNLNVPLPQTQDIYTHPAIPDGKLILIDKRRFAIQLTAMPLLLESEKIVSRQIQGEFASIITGFANLFKNGRMVLDYTTSLATNPGPTVPFRS
jgi:hypothetical protein